MFIAEPGLAPSGVHESFTKDIRKSIFGQLFGTWEMLTRNDTLF